MSDKNINNINNIDNSINNENESSNDARQLPRLAERYVRTIAMYMRISGFQNLDRSIYESMRTNVLISLVHLYILTHTDIC